ncbi:M91 family zinc metallopeptidase [Micromonospora sp. NPDC050495]|uniref:M91 family zinc metallopeptidase n=1 Tax=Micromonospora sp. NPDC050495 TaxID=3154936 RepID=UPI0033D2B426
MTIPGAPVTSAQPAPIVSDDLWSLGADPERLLATAKAWRSLAHAARDSAADARNGANALFNSGWSGDVAEAYAEHGRKLVVDLEEFAALAERGARAVDDLADALGRAQLLLDQEWKALTGAVRVARSADGVIFTPTDAAGVAVVGAAVAAAEAIRRPAVDVQQDSAADLRAVSAALETIKDAWWRFTAGATPFTLPNEPPGPGVIFVGGRMIINAGGGDNDVRVVRDPFTGKLRVEIVAGSFVLWSETVPDGFALTVRGGAGDDHVEAGEGVGALTVLGGSGDDRIHTGSGDDVVLGGYGADTIESGAGADYVSGGAGQDYLATFTGQDRLIGGSGEDTLYGGSGADRLSGGDGYDYLEGGRGDDSLDGGQGYDVLSGGRGNDTIAGGAGDDTIYTGQGTDTVSGGTDGVDGDLVYGQRQTETGTAGTERPDAFDDTERVHHVDVSNDLASDLEIEGSDEFTERVQDDLDMLRSSPNGQLMLAEMDGAQHGDPDRFRIEEFDEQSAEAHWNTDSDDYWIQYNPDFDSFEGAPPSAVLFHEMAHVYDFDNDTRLDGRYVNPDDPDTQTVPVFGDLEVRAGTENVERQAAGLPVDTDGDGDFEIDPRHPIEYTENGLRAEMRVPDREVYGEAVPYDEPPGD